MATSEMLAAQVHQYGGAEAMRLEKVPLPIPAEGEVLVQVRASGVLPADVKRRAGFFKPYGPQTFPYTAGTAFAGIVAEAAHGWQAGDRVLGRSSNGTHAEFASVPLETLARHPKQMTFTEGATVSGGASMAWQLVVESGVIVPGQRVLVHGAGGGTGVYVVQLLRRRGVHVIATASAGNLSTVQSLGADVVVDYRVQAFEDVAQNVDVVIDMVGGDTLLRSMQVVRHGGTVLTIVQPPDKHIAEARNLRAEFYGRPTDKELLDAVVAAFEDGTLQPFAGPIFALTDAQTAYARVETGHGLGRVVLFTGSNDRGD